MGKAVIHSIKVQGKQIPYRAEVKVQLTQTESDHQLTKILINQQRKLNSEN